MVLKRAGCVKLLPNVGDLARNCNLKYKKIALMPPVLNVCHTDSINSTYCLV